MSTGGLLAPLVALSLTRFGWRWTAVASGLLVLAIGVPLAQIVRHRPEAYGLRPDGDFAGAATTRLVEARSFTARQALATRAFWFISLGHGGALLVVSAVMVHMVIHVTERLGYFPHQARVVVALLTIIQAPRPFRRGRLRGPFHQRPLFAAGLPGHPAALLVLGPAGAD